MTPRRPRQQTSLTEIQETWLAAGRLHLAERENEMSPLWHPPKSLNAHFWGGFAELAIKKQQQSSSIFSLYSTDTSVWNFWSEFSTNTVMTSMNWHSYVFYFKVGPYRPVFFPIFHKRKKTFSFIVTSKKLLINCDYICSCINSFIQQVMVLLNCKTIVLVFFFQLNWYAVLFSVKRKDSRGDLWQ